MTIHHAHHQASVFLGPVCDYSLAPVARYASHWQIPVLSPGGFSHTMDAKGDYPYGEFSLLTRVGLNFNSLTNFIVKMITTTFQWSRLKLVYDAYAYSDIAPGFGFLCGSAVINTTKAYGVQHSFFVYIPGTHTPDRLLQDEIGTEAGSESLIYIREVKFDIQIGSDWTQMGQIWHFLRSVSVHFVSASKSVLKLIL